MKKLFTAVIVLAVVILSGCTDNITNVQQPAQNTEIAGRSGPQVPLSTLQENLSGASYSALPKVESSGTSYTQTINGDKGGVIKFDLEYEGGVTVHVKLSFPKKSFEGTEDITVVPNPDDFSIQFFPSMHFNKKVSLDYKITGEDLSFLHTTKHMTKINFGYIADDGSIELIKNNGVKVDLKKDKIEVKNARLKHFSRYAFIT